MFLLGFLACTVVNEVPGQQSAARGRRQCLSNVYVVQRSLIACFFLFYSRIRSCSNGFVKVVPSIRL